MLPYNNQGVPALGGPGAHARSTRSPPAGPGASSRSRTRTTTGAACWRGSTRSPRASPTGAYLCGDRFTAADLTFAALAAAVVLPPQYGVALPQPEQLPPAVRDDIEASARTPRASTPWSSSRRHRPRTGRARVVALERLALGAQARRHRLLQRVDQLRARGQDRLAAGGGRPRRRARRRRRARSRCAARRSAATSRRARCRSSAVPRSTSVPSSRRRKTSTVPSTTANSESPSWPCTMIRSIGPNVSGRAEPASSAISSARRIENGAVPASSSASTRSGGS